MRWAESLKARSNGAGDMVVGTELTNASEAETAETPGVDEKTRSGGAIVNAGDEEAEGGA
jgi:hypothetical protein